jgi:uncharacterized membrane protein YheB (UPF0754 family)
MKRDVCEALKKQIYDYVATAQEQPGIVHLSDAFQLYSDVGSRREVEQCLDQFVATGVATKHTSPAGPIYVFTQLVARVGRRWRQQLQRLTDQQRQLTQEIAQLEEERRLVEAVQQLWLHDWDTVLSGRPYAKIRHYIAGVYWAPPLQHIATTLAQQEAKQQVIEQEMQDVQRKLDESFYAINEHGEYRASEP